MVRQCVSVRPRLPLCVCEGVLLFMMLPTINHVSLRRGKTVEMGGEMTTDVPMIHRNEEKHLAAAAAGSTQGSPLSVPVFIFLLLHMSYVHAGQHTLSSLLYLITTGSFSHVLSGWL